MSEEGSFGRYEDLGLLGVGGMARVHAVRSPSGETLALKVLAVVTPGLTERFLREARLQRRVLCDNVLPVLDVIEVRGMPALLMPLVVGPSLDVLLARDPPALPQRLALFGEVVCGVAAIHEAGLMHRDLKPGNVLLDASGARLSVKVSDFGLAKWLDDLAAPSDPRDPAKTRTGAVLGTPAYMAPEQRKDASRVDARADVWALGAMLFELLTGRRPEPGETLDTGDPFMALAGRCLREDPTERPDSAVALRALLPQTEPIDDALLQRCRSLAATPSKAQPTIDESPNHLPPERDRFIGRQAEVVEIGSRLVSGVRLLVLLGPAGVGKTRLALRSAEIWQEEFPGGMYFCDLSGASDLEGLLSSVASALSVPLGKEDPIVQLGHAIAGRDRCLLLLDNFEQLTEHAARTVGAWFERAELACFLVTSRHRLGIEGEETLLVNPLEEADAVLLLRERAATREPRWVRSVPDEAALPQIVSLLDGLPLAIELCAARAALFSPAALLARLTDRFKLAADPASRTDRQRTLRSAIDWSFALLTEGERSALCQLSVFEGGFIVTAAEAVLQLPDLWPVDALQSLVDKSLIYKRQERFDLLLSIKEYATDTLGSDRIAAEIRHGSYFAAFGDDDALTALYLHGGVAKQQALARDLANLTAASRRAIARADGEIAAGAALAAWAVLDQRGPFSLGVALLEGATAHGHRRARLLQQMGVARRSAGQTSEAQECFLSALHLFRQEGDRRSEGPVLNGIAANHYLLGQMDEARAHYEAALAIAQEDGSSPLEAAALANLALLATQQGRMEEARAHYEAALVIFRAIGHQQAAGNVHGNFGGLNYFMNRPDEARAHYEAALAIAREIGDRRSIGVVLGNLGNLCHDQGRMSEAGICYERALRAHREVGNIRSEGFVLGNLGNLYKSQGQPIEARRHYEAALALHHRTGNQQDEGHVFGNLGNLCKALGQLDEARAYYNAAMAIARELGDRRSESNVLDNLGELEERQDKLSEARAHYDAALAIARDLGDRKHEGKILGEIGRMYAGEGCWDESRSCLDAGERILRSLVAPLELSSLLVNRARALLLANEHEAAKAALSEAEQLASSMDTSPQSELGGLLEQTRIALSADPDPATPGPRA